MKKMNVVSPTIGVGVQKILRIMKLTLFLTLFVVSSVFANNTFSQNRLLSLEVKNMAVEKVLLSIEEQSRFVFIYNKDMIDVNRRVDVNMDNASVDQILDVVFENAGVKYKIINNQIALSPDYSNVIQSTSVKGQITDADGNPLPGVTIVIKGTTQGTITDSEGNYHLDNIPSDAVLSVSFVGMVTQEIPVAGKSVIDLSMAEEAIGIDEVVAVGYGSTIKKNVTTSIAKVDPTKLTTAAASGVGDLLFGKAAGVQVRQFSSQPGGKVDLSIRGRGAPLLVIDGVVVPTNSLESGSAVSESNTVARGNLAGLNPNDIESIEILKDASAAIYGVNAGNGVMLITTKKGKEGTLNINYSGNTSYLKNYPYLKPLEGREFMQYYNQFEKDMYLAENGMQPFGDATPNYVPKYSQSEIDNAINTDWVGEILQTGTIQNHNLNISGGSQKVSYYVSGGFFDQVGTIVNSKMKKYNGLFDITVRPSKYFSINASVNGNRSFFDNSVAGWQSGGGGGNAYTALQAALAYPTYLPIKDENDQYTQWGVIGNPVALLNIKDRSSNSSLFVKTSVDVNIIPEVLTARVLYGNNYEESLREYYIPSDVNWFDDYRSRGSIQQSNRQSQTIETYLTFKHNFNDIVNLDLLAGFGEYIYDGYSFTNQFFDINDLFGTDKIDGATTNGFSNRYKNKQRSYFGRATVDLFDKYLVTGSLRYDGVDQFYPGEKYAAFPSVSVGWKITNESFMQGQSIFDLIKLRASYGTTGQNLPSGAAYGLFSSGADLIPFNDGQTMYIPYLLVSVDVPSLTWQKTIMQNVGLDFEAFKSRVSGNVEWFRDDVTNYLRWVPSKQLSMVPTMPVNGGHTRRTGFDAAIEGDVIRSKGFLWNMAINLSHYKHRWVERFETELKTYYLREDDPVSAMYTFETNGILQVGQEVPAWQPSTAQTPGSPLFVDKNGDSKLDSADVRIYDQAPKLIFGFNNTFKYKNFDLAIYIYGQLGSYKQNYGLNWANARNFVAGSTGGAQNATQEIKDAWSTANPNGTLPGATYNEYTLGNIGNTVGWGSDNTISKADFLRVRNITLGYNFNSPALQKYFKNARVYVDVQNAFVITKYKGADPEVETPAVKGAAAPYPMSRTYSLGVNINF
ncbi:SusC/RagA family TonB-linked outer membrane protein [Mangrovibacterium lignilyticum]|uniref:SusC/RagA family TonB-linked outer membrane protein n=1 Tax=Mangrovibacterium lignilyticum TaxID=2668052 RepID=UPI0013D0F4F0|nr:SusC/RagA family TonB-linked outer membrane protein [Mangrovibacterium lignilyticum]